jgi:hypothetical protein
LILLFDGGAELLSAESVAFLVASKGSDGSDTAAGQLDSTGLMGFEGSIIRPAPTETL